MIVWISFFVIVFIILALDLGVLTPHIISTKEATKWTVICHHFFSFLVLSIGYNNYISNPDDLKPITAIKFIT
jgi:tellurite resistance protein TerC